MFPFFAEHKSETFHHLRFSRKWELTSLKIEFLAIFEIVELNTDVVEPSLLLEIDN